MNVTGRVNCTELMQFIDMRVKLFRKSCVWIICSSSEVADSDWRRNFQTNNMKRHANTPCVDGKYYGRMSVFVSGSDGAVGQGAYISNTVNVSCG